MPLLEKLLSLVAPHDCLLCQSEGALVCEWCAPDAFPLLSSRCYHCQRITSDFALCDRCKKHTPLRHVWIRTGYEDSAMELLHRYKYERASAAARIIADAMDEVLPYLSPKTLVVPVPTASGRVRQRGYDHAALLAQTIAQKRRLMYVPAAAHLSQSRQVGANRNQRLTQLKDAFAITKPTLIKGMEILLVDDVVTTGSTLEAVAAALRRAGAKSLNAVTFAQKQ